MASRILTTLAVIATYIQPVAYRVLAIMNEERREDFADWATITSGTGAPTEAQPTGSIYLRIDGGLGTLIYVRFSGAWYTLSALISYSGGYREITGADTIGANDSDLYCSATVSLALPTPTAGRQIGFKAGAGATITLTRASSGVQDDAGAMQNSVNIVPLEGRRYIGTGSVWLQFP